MTNRIRYDYTQKMNISMEFNDGNREKIINRVLDFENEYKDICKFSNSVSPLSSEQFIFVSYSRTDTDYVVEILEQLNKQYNAMIENEGEPVSFRFWRDNKIAEEGEKEFDQMLVDKINECSAFLLFVTPNSMQSEWCGKELIEAYRNKKDIYCFAIFDSDDESCKIENIIPKMLHKVLATTHIPQAKKFNMSNIKTNQYIKVSDKIKEEIENSEEWQASLRDLINLLPEETRDGVVYADDECTEIKLCRDKRKFIKLQASVDSIAKSAFEKQDELREIYFNHVSKIGDSAFEGCDKITKLNLPPKLDYIGEYAFKDCESIKYVNFNNNKDISILREGTFDGCTNLKKIQIPENIEDLPANLFNGCENLESVIWPNKLNTIGESAFEKCSKLNLKGNCFPESLRIIDDQAFAKCNKLINIELPEKLKKIGKSAFKDCKSLSNIEIGPSVQMIGASPFRGCSDLENIHVHSKNKYYRSSPVNDDFEGFNALYNKNRSSIICVPANADFKDNCFFVPDSVTVIEEWAFAYCTKLHSIDISDSIDIIKENAFYKCVNLKNVNLPEGVDVIDDMAFRNCSSLEEVTIPNSVSKIGYAVFAGCENLRKIKCYSEDSLAYKTFIHYNKENGSKISCEIVSDSEDED